ncbi:MAG: polyphosphate:AMP phosphotransferase [Candidatus Hydrogenedentes bacterium]|nr:polyphosphate:AMP phosphotransferase [Candidatus Hydrogenedentota bacterium]
MLETIDLKATVDKQTYKQTMEALDARLSELQRAVYQCGIPVIILFEGWDASGKGAVLSRLLQPLDPRYYKVHNIKPTTAEEKMFPPLRRFWLRLPADGALGIFNHSWYRQVLDERVDAALDREGCHNAYERIRIFERQLCDDGAIILKFFLHISSKEQAKRFKAMKADPAYAWKVGEGESRRHKNYPVFQTAVEDMLEETSTAFAPWHVVPATNERYVHTVVAEALTARLQRAVDKPHAEPVRDPLLLPRHSSVLDRADLTQTIEDADYKKRLNELQSELRRLQHLCYIQRKATVIVYEGPDAGGKGGSIRRLVRPLDPRGYEVIPTAAPAGEERTHHYLWRFWRSVPKAGHFAIFDRSWYGRVMVERLEGFATVEEWQRAYREINEFEAELADAGAVLIKFWIHISKEEQLARFEARQKDPTKLWKITEEDWRNREKWDAYLHAAADMIEQTSTTHAPWTVVEGNDKHFARIKALETVYARLHAALD